MVKEGAQWNKSDDAKLIELFRTPYNGVDPEKLDKDSVKAELYNRSIGHTKITNDFPLFIKLKLGVSPLEHLWMVIN
jgi:hypothetical protein